MKPQGVFATPAVGRALATIALTTIATVALVHSSLAQQSPAPAPKAQPKVQPKTVPKAPEQPQQPAQGQQGQQGQQQPQITYTPWTKICQKGQDTKQVCFVGKDGRVESGMPIVAAVLIEPEGQPKKVLRVTLPLGMSIQPGTRVIVDSGQPMTGPYGICFNNGCMADYEASEELIAKMKRGQTLHVQGINGSGQPVSLPLPLSDFAKAYDGPPSDPSKLAPKQ